MQAAPKKFAVIKRLSNAILVVLIAVISVNLWLMHNTSAKAWYSIESEQLGRSLASQAARMLATPLANDDEQAIDAFVADIEAGGFVKGSALYDEQGKIIKSYNQDHSVVALFRIGTQQPLVFVEDIVADGKVVGYIKLVLDRQAVTEHHQVFTNSYLKSTLLTIVLTAICASLITRLFYKIRHNLRLQSPEFYD